MALVSPGVQVSVIDESFYTPAEAGTVPMLFVATASNKQNGSNTGTAPGTLAVNAGIPYLLTSQRDLVDTFGDPVFQIDSNNNPIHGSELNEYGLQAAYSFLGIANRAFVVRADIDLGQLEAQSTAPGANPLDGTYWLDTANTLWGIHEWNSASALNGGQSFTNREPIVITSTADVVAGDADKNGTTLSVPSKSVGGVGDYAVVATTNLNKIFYRNAQEWVLVGSDAWIKSWATVKGTLTNPALVTGSFSINGTLVSIVQGGSYTTTDLANDINLLLIPGITAANVDGKLELYSDGSSLVAEDSTLGGPIELVQDSGNNLQLLGILADNVQTGIFYPPSLQISRHVSVPEWKYNDSIPRPTGSIWLKTTTPNLGANLNVKKWNDGTQLWEKVDVPLYDNNNDALYNLDRTGGGSNLLAGELYAMTNVAEDARPLATIQIMRRDNLAPLALTGTRIEENTITTSPGPAILSFQMKSTDNGQLAWSGAATVSATYYGQASDSLILAAAINDANIPNVTASVVSQNRVEIKHALGGEIWFLDTDGVLTASGFAPSLVPYLDYAPGTDNSFSPLQLQASLWKGMVYTASNNEVLAGTADGTLWYNSIVDEADILVHNGSDFVGYLYDGSAGGNPSIYYNSDTTKQTDPAGPIVSATLPVTQSDGTPLVSGDLWIDTSDIENYPKIYKYNLDRSDLPLAARWFLVDTADQTTEEGILFADSRYNTSGAASNEPASISELLVSNFVDFDSPDPALYPKGMLLFNLRRSGFNVKKYRKNYVDTVGKNIRFADESMENYYADRWVTESGNQEDGSGSFGRKAQRKVVVQSLQALVNGNEDIRDDETRIFNLMACPGYPELIGEMKSLNYDRSLSAFIVGDSPFRIQPNGTVLNNWANNVNLAVEDNDTGLVTTDPYLAVYYPSGYTSDNFGNNVVVPASHMMLRTIALSDQVAYPWFAPAGTRRGQITNASSTGYITAEGEFKAVALNEGLRDTLYANHVNPITFITGAGLVAYGQKTRQLAASSLDRINVARLIIYLRSQLKVLAKPYLFEPNDKITRDEIKTAAESLLIELVGLRAVYDYIVVCDESNNTPARIDRNELYLDIAIEPVKSIEFIYIPLRLKNTGEIAGL